MTEEDFKMLSERHGLAPSRTLREYVADVLRAEQQRPTAHGPGCWSWGPRHYMCAYHEITRRNAAQNPDEPGS